MKDNRNCNQNYPVYQPMMVPPMGYPVNYFDGMYQNNTNTSDELNNLKTRLNNLENRVSRLESMGTTSNTTTNNYNKYTDSNYYMV